MMNKINPSEDNKIFKIKEDGTIMRAGKNLKLHKKKRLKFLWLLLIIPIPFVIYSLIDIQEREEGTKIEGQISQRQIEDNRDFIYVYWSFYERKEGGKAVSECSIVNGVFTVALPVIPQNYLQRPSDFFDSHVDVSNNVRIGTAYLFAYSSVSSEYSGDLYPQGVGGTGQYIYADGNINITGRDRHGYGLNLQLKKGWNSVVQDKNTRIWTVREIPYDWEWDS
ncbi:MAG: hypothetical protein LBT27_04935 [Prevotellaceae bacterium]|nr:hypothetical protein [Prevotellaceae bacterium]